VYNNILHWQELSQGVSIVKATSCTKTKAKKTVSEDKRKEEKRNYTQPTN